MELLERCMTRHSHDRPMSRRTAMSLLFGGGAAIASGCSNGRFSLLGYSTAPLYDSTIRTVYLPMFRTRMFETTPYRGIEFTLTREVANAIESKTPMKILSDPNGADTELQGSVLAVNKLLTNRTPFNGARQIALYLLVEVVWHDLRPGQEGKILTNPKRRDGATPPIDIPFDADIPLTAPNPDKAQPVLLTSYGRALPELGETSTSAIQMAIKNMAVSIVSAMEEPW